MKEFSIEVQQFAKRIDFWILGSSVGMSILSILTLTAGADRFGSKRPLIQAIALIVGLGAMLFLALFEFQQYLQKASLPLFLFSIGAIVFVILVGTGASANTWLKLDKLGLNIQPSEFVKFTFLITFSQHLEKAKDNINNIKNVLFLFIHGGVIIGLIVVSGDLGSALVFAFMMLVMLYMAGLSLWYFAGIAAVVVIALPLIWPHMAEYQQERIIYGFHPELDPIKWGYQPLMSKAAIVYGGFTGAGFSGGTYYKIVPAAQSDMLFSVLGEKFGFMGTFIYLVLLCILITRLFIVYQTLTVPSSKFITIGVAAMIIFQALENIGMCLAMLPVIGITLPFFSYGGSSLLSMFLCLGLVQNAETHNSKYFNNLE